MSLYTLKCDCKIVLEVVLILPIHIVLLYFPQVHWRKRNLEERENTLCCSTRVGVTADVFNTFVAKSAWTKTVRFEKAVLGKGQDKVSVKFYDCRFGSFYSLVKTRSASHSDRCQLFHGSLWVLVYSPSPWVEASTDNCCAAAHLVISLLLKVWVHFHVFDRFFFPPFLFLRTSVLLSPY